MDKSSTMKFIIDRNIVISSLIKDSTTRELLLNEKFDYYLPEIVFVEVQKYKSYISKKAGLTEDEIATYSSLYSKTSIKYP